MGDNFSFTEQAVFSRNDHDILGLRFELHLLQKRYNIGYKPVGFLHFLALSASSHFGQILPKEYGLVMHRYFVFVSCDGLCVLVLVLIERLLVRVGQRLQILDVFLLVNASISTCES